MAWKSEAKTAESEGLTEGVSSLPETAAPEDIPPAVPFIEPAVAGMQRTGAQLEWMRKNPGYAPMAHGSARFINRGTLLSDGTFLPEAQHPPMDGGGAMSVGVPVGGRRR